MILGFGRLDLLGSIVLLPPFFGVGLLSGCSFFGVVIEGVGRGYIF